jgi:hypothetical protein
MHMMSATHETRTMTYDYILDAYVGTTSDGRAVLVEADEVTDRALDMLRRDGLKLADLPDMDTGVTALRYHALASNADDWADDAHLCASSQ